MARGSSLDHLLVHPFWLMDLGPSELLALPVLTPLFGFTSITAPEIQGEVHEFPEGNWFFTRKVLKRATASPLTLRRGVVFYDSDFWRWMLAAVSGTTSGFKFGGQLGSILNVGGPTYRRNLLLIQYFPKSSLTNTGADLAGLAGGALTIGAAAAAGGLSGDGVTSIANLAAFNALFAGVELAFGLESGGPTSAIARIPAKMWLLIGCIPTRYKTSVDFDAGATAVSVAELDLAIEHFEELSLSA